MPWPLLTFTSFFSHLWKGSSLLLGERQAPAGMLSWRCVWRVLLKWQQAGKGLKSICVNTSLRSNMERSQGLTMPTGADSVEHGKWQGQVGLNPFHANLACLPEQSVRESSAQPFILPLLTLKKRWHCTQRGTGTCFVQPCFNTTWVSGKMNELEPDLWAEMNVTNIILRGWQSPGCFPEGHQGFSRFMITLTATSPCLIFCYFRRSHRMQFLSAS